MIVTVEPAPRRSLTTALRYRAANPPCDLADEALERLISTTTGMIENHLGRQLARERVIETFRLRPCRALLLSRTPVVTVHSVTANGQRVSGDTLSVDTGIVRLPFLPLSDEALWRDLGGPPLREGGDWPVTYAVDYTGGFTMPDDGGGGTLPADLEHACHLVLRGQLDLARRGALGITAERLGDASCSYGSDGAPGLVEAAPILARYQRLVA